MGTKSTDILNKVLETSGFITTPGFNRLIEISLDAKMAETAKSLKSKIQVDSSLDIAYKNRKTNQRNLRFFVKLF